MSGSSFPPLHHTACQSCVFSVYTRSALLCPPHSTCPRRIIFVVRVCAHRKIVVLIFVSSCRSWAFGRDSNKAPVRCTVIELLSPRHRCKFDYNIHFNSEHFCYVRITCIGITVSVHATVSCVRLFFLKLYLRFLQLDVIFYFVHLWRQWLNTYQGRFKVYLYI